MKAKWPKHVERQVIAVWLTVPAVVLPIGLACSPPPGSGTPGEPTLTVMPLSVKGDVGDSFELKIVTSARAAVGSGLTVGITITPPAGDLLADLDESHVTAGSHSIEPGSVKVGPPFEYEHIGVVDEDVETSDTARFTCRRADEGEITVAAVWTTWGEGASRDPEYESATVSVECESASISIPPDVIAMIDDPTADYIDSLSALEAAFRDGRIDIRSYGALSEAILQEMVDNWWNYSLQECGETSDLGTVVCPAGVQDFPAGDLIAVAMTLAEDVPLADGEKSLIFSAVFDSDGEAANDWVFHEPYDFDYFQGADRWYQLNWDHGSAAWSVTVTQVDAAQATAPSPSAVRVVILGDRITFYIPASELPAASPSYRMTAFGHDGSYTESSRGGDVSGDDPTQPLTSI